MEMKEKILFKTLYGSKLYGTDSENSDIDYKGVFLPNMNDLILGKAPKHYTSSTGNSNNKNTKDDVDETYYSLHYFLELAAKGDTNAIDLLFAHTNPNAVQYIDPIFKKIIANIDKIVTRNVQSYLGYCLGQAKKYIFKGDKLKNFKAFDDFFRGNKRIFISKIEKNISDKAYYCAAVFSAFININAGTGCVRMKVCRAQSTIAALINFVHVAVIKRMVSAGDNICAQGKKSIAVFCCDAAVFAGVFTVDYDNIRGIAFFESGHVAAKSFDADGSHYIAKA